MVQLHPGPLRESRVESEESRAEEDARPWSGSRLWTLRPQLSPRPRGAAWSARLPVTQEIAGSNPVEGAIEHRLSPAKVERSFAERKATRRGTQSRKSGQAQTLVNCGFDSRLRHLRTCVGWATACPTACKAASPHGYAGSTPARRTRHGPFVYRHRTLAPQAGKAGSIPARATKHDQVAQRVDARRSERRAARHGSSTLPLVTRQQAHAVCRGRNPAHGVRRLHCRRGRCPTGFHTAGHPVRYRGLQLENLPRVGQCSAGPHKPGPSGATPEPATTGYANWKSGEVESLVFVGSTPTSVTGMIPWSNGEDAWVTTRKAVVRLHPGSLRKQ